MSQLGSVAWSIVDNLLPVRTPSVIQRPASRWQWTTSSTLSGANL